MAAGLVVPQPEKEPPSVPMDYSWAQELGLIRKPASFMSSICDERGEELLYAGMPISDVFKVIDHMHCAIVKLKLKSSRMFVWSLLSCLPMTALFPSLYPDCFNLAGVEMTLGWSLVARPFRSKGVRLGRVLLE